MHYVDVNLHYFKDTQKKLLFICRMEDNPWLVDSLEVFLYFCCPECTDKSQTKESFIDHALTSHPKALESLNHLFPKPEEESFEDENLDVKPEEEFNKDDNDSEESVSEYEPDEDEECQCYYCGQTFLKIDIKNHMIDIHGHYNGRMQGQPRPIQCENCKGTFLTQSALRLHLCYEDEPIPKKKINEPYQCQHCEKSFKSRKTFRYHLQSAHIEEKRYKCTKCDYSTKTSSLLASHVQRVHVKELSHMCSMCGKRFFARVSLNKHVRKVHSQVCVKPDLVFDCDHCNSSFPHKSSLVKHLESAHDIAPKRKEKTRLCLS